MDRRPRSFPTQSVDSDLTFPFSRIDTIPYWYNSLGHRFVLSPFEIARQAEVWITERFDYGDTTPRWYETDFGRRYDYSDVSNGHGSVPRIETARLSCEWHSMFLVAGSLADGGAPVVVSDHEDATDPWHEWLSRYVSLGPDTWISDVRDLVPVDELYPVGIEQVSSWRAIDTEEFDRELLKGSELVVEGSAWRSARLGHERLSISSALVTSENAFEALVEASDHDGVMQYVIPSLSDMYHIGSAQQVTGVFPWLAVVQREFGSLDEFDPVGRITQYDAVPCWEVRSEPSLAVEVAIPPILETTAGPELRTLNWSDEPSQRRGQVRQKFLSGHSTRVGLGDLCAYLSQIDMDLAIQVVLARNVDSTEWRYQRENEPEYDPGASHIYLLRRDQSLLDQFGRVLFDAI